jgi:hypothetical protein
VVGVFPDGQGLHDIFRGGIMSAPERTVRSSLSSGLFWSFSKGRPSPEKDMFLLIHSFYKLYPNRDRLQTASSEMREKFRTIPDGLMCANFRASPGVTGISDGTRRGISSGGVRLWRVRG